MAFFNTYCSMFTPILDWQWCKLINQASLKSIDRWQYIIFVAFLVCIVNNFHCILFRSSQAVPKPALEPPTCSLPKIGSVDLHSVTAESWPQELPHVLQCQDLLLVSILKIVQTQIKIFKVKVRLGAANLIYGKIWTHDLLILRLVTTTH